MEKLRINRNLVLLGVLLVVFVLFSGLVNAACYNYENNCKITGGSGDIYTQPRCSDTVPGVKEVPQCGTSDTTNQYGCGFDNSHKKEVMVDYSYCQLKSNPGAGDPTEWVLLEDVMIEEGGTKVFYPRENKYGEYSPKCLANGKTIQYSKKHISGYYGNLANSVNDYNAQETCLDNSFCYYKSGFGTEVRCGECELDNNFVCTDYSTVDRGGNPTHKVYPKRVVGESISHNQIKHSKCVQGKCSDTLTEVNTCDYWSRE